jgi:hypothetical protein
MKNYAAIAQIIIAMSVVIVWVFRFDNIVKEFDHYRLSSLIRNIVGATKISLATLLIVGVWYPELATIPALIMAFLMFCAQFAHFKVKNPINKYFPSFVLLLLSLFVAGVHSAIIK